MKKLFILWMALIGSWGSLVALSFENQPIKAMIFDCDGVLVDTEYLKYLAWRESLFTQGIDFTIEDYMPMVGNVGKTMLRMISQLKKKEIPEELVQLKNAKYHSLQKQGVLPIQPIVDFANYLAQNKDKLGIKVALASSARKEEILTNLRQVGLEKAFDLIISGHDDLDAYVDAEGKNKPKPYIYVEAAKRLDIPSSQCIVFEDTTAGIEAAAGAGMIAVAVPNRFTLQQDFSKAKKVIASHEELQQILQK